MPRKRPHTEFVAQLDLLQRTDELRWLEESTKGVEEERKRHSEN